MESTKTSTKDQPRRATEARAVPRSAEVGAEEAARRAPPDFTAIVLAPRWRLGRRAAAKRSVAASIEALRPLARRVVVACQGAAAPAFADAGADEVVIVPDSESPLSALYYALEACPDDPSLVSAAGADTRPEAIAAMFAALRGDDEAAVAAAVDRRGLLEFPLACRASVRAVVKGCLFMGQVSLAELLRRPCARLVALD